MKRNILLFAAVLLASIGWSQTMVVTQNDGTTTKYDMNKVKSIEFTNESYDNGNYYNNEGNKSVEELLVGTWLPIKESIDYGWWRELIEDLKKNPYLEWKEVKSESITQFRSDGTASKAQYDNGELTIVKYKWYLMNNSEIHAIVSEGEYAGLSTNSLIHSIDDEKMTFSTLGMTGTMIRVPDSNFDAFIEYYK